MNNKGLKIKIGAARVVDANHANLDNLDYETSGHKGFQKQLVSGQNVKTINGNSILGEGDIETLDYTPLENKPKINNVELSGNKTNEDLNIQDKLVSGQNIKTINNQPILGNGNITIEGGSGEAEIFIGTEPPTDPSIKLWLDTSDDVVSYTITNSLTRSSNNNSATTIIEGQPYTATITPDTHYVLGNVTCTMGGVSQTVTNGVINIASVTGDIVITAKGVINTDYQEVEYIQSSGGQIIDFDFKPNQDLMFETKIQDISTGTAVFGFFGGYGTSPDRGILRISYKGFEYMYGNNGNDVWVAASTLRTAPTDFKLDGNKMYINDTLVKTYTENTFESVVNAGMFAQKASTGNTRFASVRCWGAKIKQGNVDIELVPCYRKSDDVIGMYDIINSEFYVSSGTAFSIKGGDV